MDASQYQRWQSLHGRRMSGETLSLEEQADYDTACRELDAEEQQQLDGNLQLLRNLRVQIAQADTETQRLRQEVIQQDARIALLEAHLDSRTRQLLGIGN